MFQDSGSSTSPSKKHLYLTLKNYPQQPVQPSLQPHSYDLILSKRKIFQNQYLKGNQQPISAYHINHFEKNGFFSPQNITSLSLSFNTPLYLSKTNSLFSQFPNLLKLSLWDDSFYSFQFQKICKQISITCRHLEEIIVHGKFTEIITHFKAEFPKLKTVRISVQIIKSEWIQVLAHNFSHLEEIHINLWNTNDFQHTPLLRLKKLKSLGLSTMFESNEQIERLRYLPQLKCQINWFLKIVGDKITNFQTLLDIFNKIENFESLQISFYNQPDTTIYQNFCCVSTSLKKISFETYQQFGNFYSIQVFACNNREIQEVKFRLSRQCNFLGVVEALENWPLKSLEFNGAYVNEFGIQLLIVIQPQLLSLTFTCSKNITNSTVMAISLLSELEQLSLGYQLKISDSSLMYLRKLKKLRKLIFGSSKAIFSYRCFSKLLGNFKMVPWMGYSEKWFEDRGEVKRLEENGNKGTNVWLRKNIKQDF